VALVGIGHPLFLGIAVIHGEDIHIQRDMPGGRGANRELAVVHEFNATASNSRISDRATSSNRWRSRAEEIGCLIPRRL